MNLLEGIVYIFFKAWEQPSDKDGVFTDAFPSHEDLYHAIVNRDEFATIQSVARTIAYSRALLAAEGFAGVPD